MSRRRAILLVNGRRRGGILFEVMLAVALFGGAAAFTLGAVRSVLTTLDRTRRQQEAVDLARTKLAELEAGFISLAELSADSIEGWALESKSNRSEFANLTLVELTVREQAPHGQAPEQAVSFTLRQLVALRPDEADP